MAAFVAGRQTASAGKRKGREVALGAKPTLGHATDGTYGTNGVWTGSHLIIVLVLVLDFMFGPGVPE